MTSTMVQKLTSVVVGVSIAKDLADFVARLGCTAAQLQKMVHRLFLLRIVGHDVSFRAHAVLQPMVEANDHANAIPATAPVVVSDDDNINELHLSHSSSEEGTVWHRSHRHRQRIASVALLTDASAGARLLSITTDQCTHVSATRGLPMQRRVRRWTVCMRWQRCCGALSANCR